MLTKTKLDEQKMTISKDNVQIFAFFWVSK